MERKDLVIFILFFSLNSVLCDTNSDDGSIMTLFQTKLLHILRGISGNLNNISTKPITQLYNEMNNIRQENRKLKNDFEIIFNETEIEMERSREQDKILMDKVAKIQIQQFGNRAANVKFRIDQENVNENLSNTVQSLETKISKSMIHTNNSLKEIMLDINSVNTSLLRIFADVNLEKSDFAIWQPWESYGACSQSCVSSHSNKSGLRTRTRQCAYRTRTQSQKTPICHGGTPRETVPCSPDTLCPEVQAVIDTSNYIGSSGGSAFDDRGVKNGRPITAIRLRCGGNVVASIQARYGSSWGPVHGEACLRNDRHIISEYQFNSTEYITQITGVYGMFMYSIIISTNMRSLPKCGGTRGGHTKTVSGTRLMYLKGRSNCLLDGIQPVWAVI